MIKVGDKVQIIHSPYRCVKNGTEAYVIRILFERYGASWTMYILDTKRCSTFRKHEIKRVKEEE